MRIEVRADDTVHIDGYVNVTGRDSRPIRDSRGTFIEQVVPGTFKKALSSGKPVELRFDHGRILDTGGTLKLYEDNVGLRASAVVKDTEVAEKARKKELRGWSFGFNKNKDRWEGEDPRRRYLEDIELKEVSIIGTSMIPIYTATSIETRAGEADLIEYRAEFSEAEYHIEEKKTEENKAGNTDPVAEESRADESDAEEISRMRRRLEFLKISRRNTYA